MAIPDGALAEFVKVYEVGSPTAANLVNTHIFPAVLLLIFEPTVAHPAGGVMVVASVTAK
jgi:hypothetical protein